jgi:hypothetical protein
MEPLISCVSDGSLARENFRTRNRQATGIERIDGDSRNMHVWGRQGKLTAKNLSAEAFCTEETVCWIALEWQV